MAGVAAGFAAPGMALGGSSASAAWAETQVAPTASVGDECSAGGILYAPRYLSRAGAYEVGIGVIPLVDFAPRSPGVPFIAEVGTIFQPWENGPNVYFQVGPEPKFGLRGSLVRGDLGALGWSAGYHEDMAMRGPAFGLSPAYFGLLPLPGVTSSKGGEVMLSSLAKLGPLELTAAPRVAWMSNGVRLGGTMGLDVTFERFSLGYNLDLTRNLAVASAASTGLPDRYGFMVYHGLGCRVILTDTLALQANYYVIPHDLFGNSNQLGSLGLYFRSP